MLLWSTFLGGTMTDHGYGIGLDSGGNVYVSGYSNGTWGTPIRAFSGNNDQYVAKLGPDGALLWNTFLGGTGHDYNSSLTVDSTGNSYVVGVSLASWGTPVNPMVVSPAGYRDMTVAKLNSSGTLQWNTFHGGQTMITALASPWILTAASMLRPPVGRRGGHRSLPIRAAQI